MEVKGREVQEGAGERCPMENPQNGENLSDHPFIKGDSLKGARGFILCPKRMGRSLFLFDLICRRYREGKLS